MYCVHRSHKSSHLLVDCGSKVLKLFENSFHVGGVVLSNEEEKCKNLFKLLGTMILQRKKILSEKGIGSYLSYLEAGYTDIPLAVWNEFSKSFSTMLPQSTI